MKLRILAGLRLMCFFPSLLFGIYVFGVSAAQSGAFRKIDDRKIHNLQGNVSEVRYTDGKFIRFDKTGRIIRLGDKQFSYQESCKYALDRGSIIAYEVEYSGDICREISCDTGKKTEEYFFDKEGRIQEHVIYSCPIRKYLYFYEGVEKLPYKEVYYCDTIPSGALTYYYIYLEMDEKANWLQRSVKVSGGKDTTVNRVYVETRRLKYDLLPENTIASMGEEGLNLGRYNPDRLNLNKKDEQAAYDRGKESIELSGPKKVEVGEEFEIAFNMKQRPKDMQFYSPKHFEQIESGLRSFDFRANTMIVAGDTITQYQLIVKLKANQRGKLALPSLKVRFRGKLNITVPWYITVVDAQSTSVNEDYNPAIRLVATLDKDTVRIGENAVLSLKVYTTYSKVTPVRLSKPEIASCVVRELTVDSMKWNTISFENISYQVAEYKRFQLTPMKVGKVEIAHFLYDCILSRLVMANAKLANNIARSAGHFGLIGAIVTVAATLPTRTETRNESVHTDPLYLQVLP